MQTSIRQLTLAAAVAAALGTTAADASHFRGASMVPVIDAGGVLTVTTTSFWDTTFVSSVSPSLTGPGGGIGLSQTSSVTDTSDARYTRVVQTYTADVGTAGQGAGTYAIDMGSCCRVSAGGVANWISDSWDMDAAVVWDGSSAANPIAFDFAGVQSQVLRSGSYTDNLGAVSPDALTLSYNQDLNLNITSQPPGFTIDPATGQMTIVAGSPGALDYSDNPLELGADAAFSGNIIASDGSFVEFDWMFDGVGALANQAPDVQDQVIAALVGDTIDTIVIGTDDGLPSPPNMLTWDLLSFLGPAPAIAPVFDINTQQFLWDTTGSSVGTYIANVRANDSALSDVGTLTITLSNQSPPTPGVPEPGTLMLLGASLAGFGAVRRRRRRA